MRSLVRLLNGLATLLVLAGPAMAGKVGRFSNDWTGNDLVVEAVAGPDVEA